MDVYVVDAIAAIDLARRGWEPHGMELFAPTLLRSQVLAIAHAEVLRAGGDADKALAVVEHAARLPRRLLGDAVLRRTAWRIASGHGWPETYDAEYIALTRLHGRALVAGSGDLRARAAGLVDVVTVEEFVTG